MIVDSSALLAVVLREEGYERLEHELGQGESVGVGAPTLAETAVVLHARVGALSRTLLARLLDDTGTVCLPFGERHWPVAVAAFARYGKGRHSAGLNFGDCLTYATARVAGEPLLCLGEDFAHTDLVLV